MTSRMVLSVIVIACAAVVSASESPPPEDVGSIMVAFGAYLDEHPQAIAGDLYKFLHQAVYGPGHAIPNRDAAAAWLERELKGLGPPLEDETSCTTLGGEPELVRVNLRPFVAQEGDADLLLDAFVASANQERGNAQRMDVVMKLASSYVQCAGRGELSPELRTLSAELAEKGYPAIHHSEEYAEVYRPAYRVVSAELAAIHGWCEEPTKRSR